MRRFLILSLASAPILAAAQVSYKTVSENHKHWTMKVRYPIFQAKSPIASMANKSSKQWAMDRIADFKKTTKEIGNGWTPVGQLTLEATPVMAIVRADLISFHMEWYDYQGGAHPNSGKEPFSFGYAHGNAKKLTLSDLLSPGNTADGFMAKVVRPIVDKEKRSRGMDLGYTFEPGSKNRFVLTPKGIAFFFNSYEIGSYAEGPYEANVMYAGVRARLNRSGPLKNLLKD